MRYSTKTLQHRLVAYVTLGLLIFSTIAGILTYQYSYQNQLKTSSTVTKQLISVIQSQAEIAAFVANEEIGVEIINGLLTSPLINGVRIESTELFKLEATNEPSIDFTKGIIYPLYSPVDNKEIIGKIIVVKDNNYIRKEATKVSVTLTILMVSQLLMAAILILWVSKRIISKPVADLAWSVFTIKPGTKSYIPIKPIHLHDEIGLLSRSINSLINAAEIALTETIAAKKAAEAATLAKSEFLANMSHEIRTPMNAIIGFSRLVLKTELSTKQRDYISKIQSSSISLLEIINDILDFSKIEANKITMESIDFRLDKIVSNTATMLSIKAAQKGIEIIHTISQDVPHFVVGDPLRLGQVLLNIANNAVKFTHTGHILIKAELIKKSEPEFPQSIAGDRCIVRFSISDTGIGMKPEQISKLFQPFTQGDTSITRKFGGTGLGLSISKSIVDMMGGEITVKSEFGAGSTFSFTAVFTISKHREEQPLILPDELNNLKTLIVDDNEMAREVLVEQMRSFGFETFAVDSGQAALSELQQASSTTPYELVLVDWKMPEMDGIELSRKIKNNLSFKTTPLIIMVTAFGREEIMTLAHEVGINGFLIKPVNPSLMLDSIMNVFNKKLPTSLNRAGVERELTTKELQIKGSRLLVVEDNHINQQVAIEILTEFGLIVDIANNGKEAIDKLVLEDNSKILGEELCYELVLMDIQMPIMGGYEATAIIKNDSRFRKIPVVAMTAHAMEGAKELCLKSGMDDYIAKPIDPEELLSILTKWIKPRISETINEFNHEQYKQVADNKENMVDSKAIDNHRKAEDDQYKENVTENIYLPENLPGIDIKSALKRLNGNRKLYRQLLLDFARNYASVSEEVKESIYKGDFNRAERVAHTLKGIGGNLSAGKIVTAARTLEYAIASHKDEIAQYSSDRLDGRQNSYGILNDDRYNILLTNLNNSINPLIQAIQSIVNIDEKRDEYQTFPIDLEHVQPIIIQLARYLKANDANSLTSFEALKKMMINSILRDKVLEMENHIDNFDFVNALSILRTIAQSMNIKDRDLE